MKKLIKLLKERGLSIGVMESCTGGAIANAITNIPGASDVFEEGLVTYSIKAKIKHGVDPKIIKKFGVFSKETAEEMARKASGDIGVGVSGELPGTVFYAVRILQTCLPAGRLKITNYNSRVEMKEEVVSEVIHMLLKSVILGSN